MGYIYRSTNYWCRANKFILGIYNNLGLTNLNSLSDIGVTIDKNGKLSVDSSKLNDALTNDANEVKALFQGPSTSTDANDGLMDKLYNYLDSQVRSIDGNLVLKSTGYTDSINDINDLIDTRQDRIDAYQDNLKARFANLEIVLANLKNMETTIENFSDQMSSLNSRKS